MDFITELDEVGMTLGEFCAKSDHTQEEVVQYASDPEAIEYLRKVLSNVLAF